MLSLWARELLWEVVTIFFHCNPGCLLFLSYNWPWESKPISVARPRRIHMHIFDLHVCIFAISSANYDHCKIEVKRFTGLIYIVTVTVIFNKTSSLVPIFIVHPLVLCKVLVSITLTKFSLIVSRATRPWFLHCAIHLCTMPMLITQHKLIYKGAITGKETGTWTDWCFFFMEDSRFALNL